MPEAGRGGCDSKRFGVALVMHRLPVSAFFVRLSIRIAHRRPVRSAVHFTRLYIAVLRSLLGFLQFVPPHVVPAKESRSENAKNSHEELLICSSQTSCMA